MKKTQENAIMNQYENSSEHQANTTRGLTIDHHTEIGEGNLTQSVIEYDNGEVWIFGLNGEPERGELFCFDETVAQLVDYEQDRLQVAADAQALCESIGADEREAERLHLIAQQNMDLRVCLGMCVGSSVPKPGNLQSIKKGETL